MWQVILPGFQIPVLHKYPRHLRGIVNIETNCTYINKEVKRAVFILKSSTH